LRHHVLLSGFPFNLNSATSKNADVNLDAGWQIGYKRQMEFHQWLLRQQGLNVSSRGWFVYCNSRCDLPAFDAKLEFRIKLIPYEGDNSWVEPTLLDIRNTLHADASPAQVWRCEYCAFARKATSGNIYVRQTISAVLC